MTRKTRLTTAKYPTVCVKNAWRNIMIGFPGSITACLFPLGLVGARATAAW